ncbi:MAG TPA: hypothetical protein VGD65_05605 [Chryseosolibacter sp.]
MKPHSCLSIAAIVICLSCHEKPSDSSSVPIQGTWRLLTGTLIEKGDTTVTDYTAKLEMIKIINATHFSFLNHDRNHGKDSTASFAAGGGTYTLMGDEYVEHLEFCSDRQWEGHDFTFRVEIKNDTLLQTGTEVIEDLGINRLNIERYVRVVN